MMLDRLQKLFHGADSVRTAIAMAFTAAVIYGFLVDKIGADVFMATASLAIGFYFNRANNSNGPAEPK